MSILTVHNVGQSYGAFDVFNGISGAIPHDAKIGLVGPNGIGKTTLLTILAGLAEPSTGAVHRAQGVRIGYLRQEAVQAFAGRENTVHQEMLTVFAPLRAQEAQLRAMEEAFASGDPSDELLEQYGQAQERFEQAGGYDYEGRIKYVLEGLGFRHEQWDYPLTHLSGGQKTRLLLGRLLLERPNLLILDEPTNHLDVEAIEWLENTLWQWEGAILIVSHDRYFLDKVVNRIWEMTRTHLESYRGNYSAYLLQRQERWERHEQLYESTRERLEKELEFIRRNIAGQNTDIATGRLKRLSRDLVAIEEVGILGMQNKNWGELGIGRMRPFSVAEAAQRIGELPRPSSRPPRVNIGLKTSQRSGDIVLRTTGLRVGYGDNVLFMADDILLHRQECAALIGPNGTGKTTFLRTVLDQLPPIAGDVRLGANLKVGYFAQAHDQLNLDNSVIGELQLHRQMSAGEARDYLAQYLFRGDDVFKSVGALSGGERGRLALAILALKGANFLLLDEPTNHLDIPAQEVLQEVLERFEGTVLLVSHDRYLVNRLATQIWELREGRLTVFTGSYQEFVAAREEEARARKEIMLEQKAIRAAANGASVSGAKMNRRRAEAVAALESRIAEMEIELDSLTHKLQSASEAGQVEEMQQLGERFGSTQAALDRLIEEWEGLAGELETAGG